MAITVFQNKVRVQPSTWFAMEPNWKSIVLVGIFKEGQTSGDFQAWTSLDGTDDYKIEIRHTALSATIGFYPIHDGSSNKGKLAKFADVNNTHGGGVFTFPWISLNGSDFEYFEIYYIT